VAVSGAASGWGWIQFASKGFREVCFRVCPVPMGQGFHSAICCLLFSVIHTRGKNEEMHDAQTIRFRFFVPQQHEYELIKPERLLGMRV